MVAILILMIWPTFPGSADVCVFIGKPVAGASDHCTSCNPGDPADVMCEDFEGTGYLCSGWTETEGTGSIDADATHSGTLDCTDKGSQAVEIQLSTGTACYVRWDNGSEETEANFQWYFNIVSENLADGQNFIVGKIQDGSNVDMCYWRLQQVSGQLQILVRVKNTSDGWTDGSTYNVSTGNWYRWRGTWVDGTSWDVWLANDDGTGETKVVDGVQPHAGL